jgi:hypothetical protein
MQHSPDAGFRRGCPRFQGESPGIGCAIGGNGLQWTATSGPEEQVACLTASTVLTYLFPVELCYPEGLPIPPARPSQEESTLYET